MGYIYLLTFPDGKQYIGQTKRSVSKRVNEHKKCTGKCIALENAIKLYGEHNFMCEILLETNNIHLDYYETRFIEVYNTVSPHGYNIRSGGTHGIFTETSRTKMRLCKMGNLNHNFGKPRSESTRVAISDAKRGEKHHFYGKTLHDDHKSKLSLSHKIYDKTLPMYIVYIKERPEQYQSSGYAVINHPLLKTKYFTSKKFSENVKLQMAKDYINSMNAVQRLNGDG